jgi:benzoate-CoA ligase
MNLLPDFRYHRPATLDEAARLKAGASGARFIAGGTDLLVNLRRGLGEPTDLIDVTAIADLAAIRRDGDALWIGAGATLAALARHADILADYPALADAVLVVAGPTHRAAATLGGNLCQDTRCIFYNQSDWWRQNNGWCLKYRGDKCHVVVKSDRCYATYHGDVAPVLMVLDAEAVLAGADGVRRIPLADLYRENGAEHLTLAPGEMLTAVVLPPQGGQRAAYAKARVRDAIDFPLAGVAVALRRDGDVIGDLRVAITGTNSAPLMIDTSALIGRAWDAETARSLAAALRKKANILRTTVIGAKYRRRAIQAMVRKLVDDLWLQSARSRAAASSSRKRPVRFPLPSIASVDERILKPAVTHNLCEQIVGWQVAAGLGDTPAILAEDRKLTFSELASAINRVGNALKGAGVHPGDRILLLLRDTPELVAGWLGAVKIGAVAVALNTRSSARDIAYMIENSECTAFLLEAEFEEVFATATQQGERTPPVVVRNLTAFTAEQSDELATHPVRPDDPAFWFYTSGTTGTPKSAIHCHRVATIAELHLKHNMGLTPGDRVFSSSKLFFAFGLSHCLMGALKGGATIILHPGWPDAEAVGAVVCRHRPSIFLTVPTMYRNLLRAGQARREEFRAIRHFISGGEALPTSVFDDWIEATGTPILEGIGASETTHLVVVNTPTAYKKGSVGKVVPWAQACLLTEDGREAAAGESGVLYVRMASVAAGYWKEPEKTTQTFQNGWYRTGDVFAVDDDGWWHHQGRADDMLKISGQWVSPREIEECALAVPGIIEAAAVGVRNEDGLVRLWLTVVAEEGMRDLEVLEARLHQKFEQTLSVYKRPRRIRFVKQMPRTVTGKLQRFKVREMMTEVGD